MSDEVYVIRNQLGQFWARSGDWVDGREPQRLLKQKHRDEAVNQLVELSAKDIDLRGEVLACPLGEKREPKIEVSEHRTPTLSEKAAAASEQAAAETAHAAAANESAAAADERTQDSAEAADPGLRAAAAS